jgi:hypothetical protein
MLEIYVGQAIHFPQFRKTGMEIKKINPLYSIQKYFLKFNKIEDHFFSKYGG